MFVVSKAMKLEIKTFSKMKLTPEQFLSELINGKTEYMLNKTESLFIDPEQLKKLTSKKYGHSVASAKEHLTTDYSFGFTICDECGSYYELGSGFTKHLSKGCLNCQGEEKHRVYHVNASRPSEGGFPARYMSVMFDDGMSYCKDRLQKGKYMKLTPSTK